MAVPAFAFAGAVIAGIATLPGTTAMRFAPPLDQTLTVTIERVETQDTQSRAYRSEREIAFRREGAGYRAEVTLRAVGGAPDGDSAAMFEAGMAALIGRTIVFHLDSDGSVVRIDEAEAIWAAFCQGLIDAIVAKKGGTAEKRAKLAERLIGPLMAIPAEQRFARLASLVDPLIAGAGQDYGEGTTPVRMPARSPYGGQLMFDGTRTVSRHPGKLAVSTSAQGDVAIPDGSGVHARIAVTMRVGIDPATGLVTDRVETVRTQIGEGPQARVEESVTRTKLLGGSLPVS